MVADQSSTAGGATLTLSDLRGDTRRARKERAIRGVLFGAAALSVLISIAIVLSLLGRAILFLQEVNLSSLWSIGWFPRRGYFDIRTILVGSLMVASIGMLVATPLGLGAAVYLSEYASHRARRFLKPIVEVLAGIPSVVLGYFALQFISPHVVQRLFTQASIFNAVAAGIAVGILIVPLIASVAEDAMHAVPGAFREASYGIGARKRTTSMRVVVPAAISGIVAALILGVSRAIGETMIVSIAAGGTGGSLYHLNPLLPTQTMTGAMASLATGSDAVGGNAAAYPSLFFVGLLLFALTLALNGLSERVVRRFRREY